MASESSFDVVSKVDRQEVDNALNQAAKEVAQRYDFKNVGASIAWSGGPELALYGFIVFYATCLAVTWWWYFRRGAETPC